MRDTADPPPPERKSLSRSLPAPILPTCIIVQNLLLTNTHTCTPAARSDTIPFVVGGVLAGLIVVVSIHLHLVF